MEWHFQLVAEPSDLKALLGLFRTLAKLQHTTNGEVFLVMDLPCSASDSADARKIAEGRLACMNGIAQLEDGDHNNVRVGRLSCEDPARGTLVFVQSADRLRLRDSVEVSITDGAGNDIPIPLTLPIGDRFLVAANKDADFERALFLLGSVPLDWRGLYMVLEVAEDAHDGEKGLIAKNWVPNGQIKDFKATANSYKAIGKEARHGSEKNGLSDPKFTLEQASAMVRTILEEWMRSMP